MRICHNFPTKLKCLLEENDRDCLLQHDGTTVPGKHITNAALLEFFADRISGLGLWLSSGPGF
jgi:hypothetical protein